MSDQPADLTEAMDALMREVYKENEPGATVLVAKNGKPVFRKGYGMANLELGVANEPHMVFRLGSITKQFTAVSILMLYEQGKLKLEDEITQYLPDYPTHGHAITILHLLYHTSGIKSYTGMPEWLPMMNKDMTVEEMVNFFKNQPMEFAPGEKWNYNNSGYFLLGAIIEKLSGMTYAEFVHKNIFEPLGMDHTYYDMPTNIIPGRVSGYKVTADGFENANYISMTQPYAAGSLASSVDDMLLWDEALYGEKLVSQETLKKAWTSGKLNNGETFNYGFGWAVAKINGTRIITHGGGINGFLTDGVRLPDDHVYVSMLTNAEKPFPDLLAYKLAALAAGRPYQDPESVEVPVEVLQKYPAVYTIQSVGFDIPVEFVDGKLMCHLPISTNPNSELKPLSETEFFISDSPHRITFELDADGAVTGLTILTIYGGKMKGIRTDKPLPSQRESIQVEKAILEQYTGLYQVAPGIDFSIQLEEGSLMAIAPGQPKMQLFAETESVFFMKEAPVSITFEKDAAGCVSGMLIDQGGEKMPAKKVK